MSLIAGELRKLLTVRTALWFVLGSMVLALVNAFVVGLASGVLDEVAEKEEALGGMPILMLFFGSVAVAAGYRHHTAAPAVLLSGRSPAYVSAARLFATTVVGAHLALLTTGAAFTAGIPILAHQPGPDLTVSQLVPLFGWAVLAGTLSVLLGGAVGGLLRRQTAAVVVGVVIYFVAPSLVGMLDASAVDYTPFGSMQVLTKAVHGAEHSLPASALALAVWALVPAALMVSIDRRRDLV